MHGWFGGADNVELFVLDGAPVAYAVWREEGDVVSLRQFFVAREWRRCGVGRRVYALLRRQWHGRDVKIDVRLDNDRGLAFWRSLGFEASEL